VSDTSADVGSSLADAEAEGALAASEVAAAWVSAGSPFPAGEAAQPVTTKILHKTAMNDLYFIFKTSVTLRLYVGFNFTICN
ncbi:MAG: hypothetical protein K6G83_02390, partial [Lachnospiraceae bacterium]|nr:hypothetical protein [Lachnospiraceae bacterium]